MTKRAAKYLKRKKLKHWRRKAHCAIDDYMLVALKLHMY